MSRGDSRYDTNEIVEVKDKLDRQHEGLGNATPSRPCWISAYLHRRALVPVRRKRSTSRNANVADSLQQLLTLISHVFNSRNLYRPYNVFTGHSSRRAIV